jgi:hypothetical protein
MVDTCETCKFARACGVTKMGGFWCHSKKDWTYAGKWCSDYHKGKKIPEEKTIGY